MAMNHKIQNYMPENTEKHPMNRLDKKYDQLIGEERNKSVVLSVIVVALLIYTIGSLFLLKYAINLPKSVPMVIEVAPWGEAINVGDISQYSYSTIDVPEKHKKWVINMFITNLRSLSSDPQIVHDNIASLFYMITSNIADKVRDSVRNPDIFSMVGRKTVTIVFESTIRISEKTYQVDWIENTKGEDSGQKRYRGLFSIELLEPTEKQEKINPLGVFIHEYDIVELDQGVTQ